MASLSDRVQTALQESRVLLLASQVFLGFELRAPFEPGFDALPHPVKLLKLASLGLMVAVIAILVLNAAWHRIVERGEDHPVLLKVLAVTMEPALALFALVLGANIFTGALDVYGPRLAVVAGLLTTAVALASFHLYGYAARPLRRAAVDKERQMERKNGENEGRTRVKDKIQHVLTEMRVTTPGAQALLGFQFSLFLMSSFAELPEAMKRLHFASVCCTTLAIILLLVPPAYHRIAERGEQTEHFHKLASVFLVLSMFPLAAGLALDVFVVVAHGVGDRGVALAAGVATFALCMSLWFGVTFTARLRRGRRAARLDEAGAH